MKVCLLCFKSVGVLRLCGLLFYFEPQTIRPVEKRCYFGRKLCFFLSASRPCPDRLLKKNKSHVTMGETERHHMELWW